MTIAGPAFVIGALFLVNWLLGRNSAAKGLRRRTVWCCVSLRRLEVEIASLRETAFAA